MGTEVGDEVYRTLAMEGAIAMDWSDVLREFLIAIVQHESRLQNHWPLIDCLKSL